MDKAKTILFLHSSVPQPNKLGSNVIFYRHLIHLEKSGWKIVVAFPDKSKNPNQRFPKSWDIIVFPYKKWWHLPYREYFGLKTIRYFSLFTNIKKKLVAKPPDFIIGYLWGTYISGLDAYISRKLKIPLGVFYHDDQKFFTHRGKKNKIEKHEQSVVAQASIVWTVSEDLIFGPSKFFHKHIIIPPIPEEKTFSEVQSFPQSRNLVYAGRVYPPHRAYFESLSILLEKIGWSLTIITNKENKWESKSTNTVLLPLFQETGDLLQYLNNNAGALIVAYPEKVQKGQMEWIKNCFPSKFIEFVITGIPTIAVAPKWTSFGKWCIKREWPLYSEAHKEVPNLIEKLEKSRLLLDRYNARAKEVALGEFNPNSIHTKFEESILKVIRQTATGR